MTSQSSVAAPATAGSNRFALRHRMQCNVGFDFRIHHAAANGATVLTDRTDALIIGPVRLQFWVFEVLDGRITLWRDYFDLLDVIKATGRAMIGAAVPRIRPRFNLLLPDLPARQAQFTHPSKVAPTDR